MAEGEVERTSALIVSADVFGFSRLVGGDEAKALVVREDQRVVCPRI